MTTHEVAAPATGSRFQRTAGRATTIVFVTGAAIAIFATIKGAWDAAQAAVILTAFIEIVLGGFAGRWPIVIVGTTVTAAAAVGAGNGDAAAGFLLTGGAVLLGLGLEQSTRARRAKAAAAR